MHSREIAAVSALAALGNAEAQLDMHIRAAMNVGVSHQEIEEVLIQTSVYAGFPAVINGILIFKAILKGKDEASKDNKLDT